MLGGNPLGWAYLGQTFATLNLTVFPGVAIETDTALAAIIASGYSVGVAIETDTALGFGGEIIVPDVIIKRLDDVVTNLLKVTEANVPVYRGTDLTTLLYKITEGQIILHRLEDGTHTVTIT